MIMPFRRPNSERTSWKVISIITDIKLSMDPTENSLTQLLSPRLRMLLMRNKPGSTERVLSRIKPSISRELKSSEKYVNPPMRGSERMKISPTPLNISKKLSLISNHGLPLLILNMLILVLNSEILLSSNVKLNNNGLMRLSRLIRLLQSMLTHLILLLKLRKKSNNLNSSLKLSNIPQKYNPRKMKKLIVKFLRMKKSRKRVPHKTEKKTNNKRWMSKIEKLSHPFKKSNPYLIDF